MHICRYMFAPVFWIQIRPDLKLFDVKDPDPDTKLLISDLNPAPDPDHLLLQSKLWNIFKKWIKKWQNHHNFIHDSWKFKKSKISTLLCSKINQKLNIFLQSLVYRRIRIQNTWFSIWGPGSGSENNNFGSGTLVCIFVPDPKILITDLDPQI